MSGRLQLVHCDVLPQQLGRQAASMSQPPINPFSSNTSRAASLAQEAIELGETPQVAVTASIVSPSKPA